MTNKKLKKLFSAANLLGFLGVVAVNILANALPLNGRFTGEISDRYPNLFVPAGWTFSIWGLIYLLLAVFIVYQLADAFGRTGSRSHFLERIGLLFFVSCLANVGWLFAWHYELLLVSLPVMLVLLVSLIGIYRRLRVGRSSASRQDKLLVHLPFSVYLGWITVATIANVTVLLVSLQWNRFGLGEQLWTVLLMAVAVLLAITVLLFRRDIFYALVVDWALVGIVLKRLSEPVPAGGVVAAGWAGIALITLGVAVQGSRGKVY
ncbi:MAG: hypothetical protein ACOC8N_05195 [Spirochaetota bacterium]